MEVVARMAYARAQDIPMKVPIMKKIKTVVCTTLFWLISIIIIQPLPVIGFPNYEAHTRFIGEYPANDDPDWSNDLQGLTHDAGNWFITQTWQIWKIPVGVDLNHAADGQNGVFYKELDGGDYAILEALGYDHFGDPCYYEHNGTGFVIVPVEDNDDSENRCGALAFLNPGNLSYISHTCIDNGENRNRASWCAVDSTGLIYSSIDRNVSHINLFNVNWDMLVNQQTASLILPNPPPIVLRDESGISTVLTGDYLQGGALTPSDELLYMMHGNQMDYHTGNGIHVFDLKTGNRVARSSRISGLFFFQWSPGFLLYQEPEGMTFWDLDNKMAPGISGQIHVILFEPDPGNDNVWLKHYSNATYVDQNAQINQDGTVYLPFETVTQAANLAWDGSLIRIYTGIYPESVTIPGQIQIQAISGPVVIGE